MQAEYLSHQPQRIQSVDVLRGIVMIIMAIDHVRVYSGVPAGGPTATVFFTRWITNFCAPAFVFFAGTGAFLYLQKVMNKNELMKFLFIRGIILVVLEVTVVKFFWMFNFDYGFTFTGVIWMLGWCMIFFALFVKLRPMTLGILGVIIIFGQQIFQFFPLIFPDSMHESVTRIWGFFYPVAVKNTANILSGTGGVPTTFGLSIFYVIIPWIGVMMAGYAFGTLLILPDGDRRKKWIKAIGLSATLLFIVAGTIVALYFSSPEDERPFIFKLLAQQKYPPSQLFLLMTLGPVIASIPWAEKLKGRIAGAVATIGRVPMFYYLVHLLLIHLSALAVNLLLKGNIHQDYYQAAPFVNMPEEQRWGVPLLYFVWMIDVVILYIICNWYATYKRSHPEIVWMKYI